MHADFSLQQARNFQFACATNSVPVLASEFKSACRQYPIVFAAAEGAQPLAMLGVSSGENLFVDKHGQWAEEHHIPAYVRRYPFIFMESPDRQEFTLCIDAAAENLICNAENPLFKDGLPTQLTQEALTFCRAFQDDYQFTREFAAAAVGAELLVDNRADISFKNGEKVSLSGFRVIDEQRFNKLPDATVLNWRERGWLQLVYAHFISINSWSALLNRGGARRAAATNSPTTRLQ
jgi:hypothetical protein